MSERKWHEAGASGAEQAFIDGTRYTVAPSEQFQGGYIADGTRWGPTGSWFATRDEAKAACHGYAVALRVAMSSGEGEPVYADEVPAHWRPERYTRCVG